MVLIHAGAALSALTLPYMVTSHQSTSLIVLGACVLAVALGWARNSASRLGLLGAVLLIGVPLVPGMQETRQPQLFALLVVSVSILGMSWRLAAKRRRRARVSYAAFIVLSVLTCLTVGVEYGDQFRLLTGLVLASTVALPLAISAAAEDSEMRTILGGLTVIAVVAAGVAFYEAGAKAPLYKFTTFQTHANPLITFRASAFFGHPLVLCVFLSFVALANMIRPRWDTSKWYTSRLLTVAVPLAGAAASGSRSIALFIAVGILGIVFMRQDTVRRKWVAFLMVCAALVLGYFTLSGDSALVDRFGGLTTGEQSVRLNGFSVVTGITQGLEVFIGAGPRSVAAAYLTSMSGATFGTVDNEFFTTYADYGLAGLALIVMLVLRLIAALRSKGPGPWAQSMVVASMAPLAAFVVMDTLSWPILALLFGLGSGATMNVAPATPATSTASAHEAVLTPHHTSS